MTKRVAFLTLGCAKNEQDSAQMQQDLVRAGYEICSLDEPCDAIVVNTCAFIQPAIEESIDTVLDISSTEAVQAGVTKLVVSGCMPARFGAELEAELTEADRFVPCAQESAIVHVMDDLLQHDSSRTQRTVSFTYEPSEYVKISDGCSRHCSFCTIPLIRGPYHSFSFDQIERDVKEKIDGGSKEIVFIAQDSGIWGLDLKPRETLASLLDRIADAYPATWFRVMYLQPAGLTDELVEVMAAHSNICSYLDIPLQHCDSDILSSMNRRGSRAEYEALVARLRDRIPDITLRTTLIVGYPGETDEQFEDLCDFVAETAFDYVGIFAYSPEDGTPAAELPDQIDDETKQDRLQTLRDIADAVSSQRISGRIGASCDVLVLGAEEDGQLFGRTQAQAPDVDGVTYIDGCEVGEMVPAIISDTLLYEMEATRD
ncbi:MAG: 30S ribosomal protein S12 methylthiotransferase RimO [Eggerthellaceae bacterium]